MLSPYLRPRKYDKEVLLLYNTIDDFVMSNVKTYAGRDLVSAEDSSVDLGKEGRPKDEDEDKDGKEDKDDEGDGKDEGASARMRTTLSLPVSEP